jgi:hypothetical protein
MNFQVNSSNTQSGRTYNWNKAGTGYGNGSNLMSLAADTNVLALGGSVNSRAYSIPGQSGAGTYQYGLTNSPTWNTFQGSYTNNNSTAPDGSTTAGTYTLTASSYDLYQTIAATNGVVYKVGVWVKLGTATNFCIVVNNTQAWNTIGGKAFNSSDGLSTSKWTHISFTFTGPSTGSINLHIGGHSESITQQTAGTVFIWNWEVTTGNSTWVGNIDDEIRLPNTSIFTSRGLLGLGTYSPNTLLDVRGRVNVVQGGRTLSLGDGSYANHILCDSNVDFAFNYNNASTGGFGFFGGTSSAKFMCSYTGTLTVAGDLVAYGSPSDVRLKTIKEKIPNALDTILKLNGYRFDWKEKENTVYGEDKTILHIKEDIGVIAQEVAEVLPELARTNDDGYMSVRYQGLTAVLIEAIKELSTENQELKARLELIEAKIKD